MSAQADASSFSNFSAVVRRIAEQSDHQYDINDITLFLSRYVRSGNNVNNYTVEQLVHDANEYITWYNNLSTTEQNGDINPLAVFSALTNTTLASAGAVQNCSDLFANIFNNMRYNQSIASEPLDYLKHRKLLSIFKTIFYNISIPKTVQMLDALFRRDYPGITSVDIRFYQDVSRESITIQDVSGEFYGEHKIEGGCDINVDDIVRKIISNYYTKFVILLALKNVIKELGIGIVLVGNETTGRTYYTSLLEERNFNNITSDIDLDIIRSRLGIEN